MGRASGTRVQGGLSGSLRIELQRHLERGECAYCRAPARPDRPLTREHVIPRARGGRRNDVRIIIPACVRCNQHRGSRELVPFLLSRPQRISALLDYLGSLTSDSLRELDPRILADVWVAVAILSEAAADGSPSRDEVARLSTGRSLHRRRYAARRALTALERRLPSQAAVDAPIGPTCLVPRQPDQSQSLQLEEPIERLASRVLAVVALVWGVPAETIGGAMAGELGDLSSLGRQLEALAGIDSDSEVDGVVRLDGWKARPKRKRTRVDRRQGRVRRANQPRGRAA